MPLAVARPVRMPPLGTTSDELRIVEWLKGEGEEVALGEPLLAVETDKATLEVEAATAGTLLKVLRAAGEVVEVGDVVGYIGVPGEELPHEAEPRQARDGRAPAGGEPDVADVDGAVASGLRRSGGARRATAAPAVRRLAAEHGIDLAAIEGSGPEGRVERADVLAVLEARRDGQEHSVAAAAQPLAASGGGGDLVPPRRQALARRLSRSAAIPQFSVAVTVDMTRAVAFLERERAAGLPGLGYTHLLLRATASALRAHPALNAVWVEEGPRRRALERTDVGLAVAGDDGLLVVTIPEPDRLALPDLVEQTERAAAEARAGRVSERFGGRAAITLSNLGMVGVDRFVAVVDPEQTAILAAGAVVERPGAVGGVVALVPQLELVLTADHRVVDGMAAGRFLAGVRDILEDPAPGADARACGAPGLAEGSAASDRGNPGAGAS